jgi:hypothetical protein
LRRFAAICPVNWHDERMDDGDGVYFAAAEHYPEERPGPRRIKKAAVAVVGLAALLGGGSFLITTVLTAHSRTSSTREPAALAPAITHSAPVRSAPAATAAPPAPGPIPGTLGAARQSSRPSPTPSPSLSALVTDDDIAAAQVNRLLQAPSAAPSGMVAAQGGVTVVNSTGSDGSAIRTVSARYDVTARWELLLAADSGRQVGNARCSRNFRAAGSGAAQARPGLLLCWRTSGGKSVVTVAMTKTGSPGTTASIAAMDRAWVALG